MIVRGRIRRAGPVGRAARVGVGVLALALAGGVRAGEKYALVIGTNSYQSVGQIPTLKYPEKDVDALTAALERQGFKVTPLKASLANREWIVRELARFALVLTKDDMFLLAFSGHGVRHEPVNQETYWLTYDTQLDSLDVSGIRLKHLLDYIQDIPAAKKLVLLDHCFSGNITLGDGASGGGSLDAGATTAGGAPRGGTGSIGLDPRGQTLDISLPAENPDRSAGLVLLAASYGLAFESRDWEHGVFTQAVLEAIDEFQADQRAPAAHGDGDGRVSVAELIAYVEKRVPILAEKLHINQFVVPKQANGVGLAEWILAATHRGPTRADLTNWLAKSWMTGTAYTSCLALLALAEESESTHVALAPNQDRKLQLIREVHANPNQSERDKARAVNELCSE